MRYKWLIWSGAAVLVLVFLAAGAAGGMYYYRRSQEAEWLTKANEAYEKGDWTEASNFFSWYIPRQREDVEALEKYAHANLQITTRRQFRLQRAAQAYHQVLQLRPGDHSLEDQILDIYERMRSWSNLEYYARDYLAERPDDTGLRIKLAYALENVGRGGEAVEEYEGLIANGVEDAVVYRRYAELLRDREERDKAAEILDLGLERLPDSVDMRLARADYFAGDQDWDAVEAELDAATQLQADNPGVLAQLARLAATRAEYEKARELALRAIEVDPENDDLYPLLANVYARLGQPKKGVEVLESAGELRRADNPELYVTQAELQIGMGEYEGARETAKEYLDAYPEQQPIADYLQGRELLALGDAEEAADVFSLVTELRPGFLPARFYLALSYLAAGKRSLGRSTLEEYLVRNPGDMRARALLDQQSTTELSIDEVAERATKILESNNPSPSVLSSTAYTLFDASVRAGAPEEHFPTVKRLFEEAIALRPNSPLPYRGLAEAYIALGKVDAAQEILGRASAAGVPEVNLLATRASIALAEDNLEQADAYLQQALAQDHVGINTILGWSELYSRRGYGAESVAVLERAAEHAEGDRKLRLLAERAKAAARAGMHDEAMEQIDQLLPSVDDDADLVRVINETRNLIALAKLEEGSPEGTEMARQLIEDMRALDPGSVLARGLEGQLLLSKEPPSYDEAKTVFEEVLQQDPDNITALIGLYQIAYANDRPRVAAANLERAVLLEPQNVALRLRLAELQIRLGRHEEAQRALRGMLAASPDQYEAARLLAYSLLEGGEAGEVRALIDEYAGKVPPDSDEAQRWALLQEELTVAQGSPVEAESALRVRLQQDPGNLGAAKALAVLLGRNGRWKEGEEVLMDVVDQDPAKAESWTAYAQYEIDFNSENGLSKAASAATRALLASPGYLPALLVQIDIQLAQNNYMQVLALCDRYLAKRPDDEDVLFKKATVLLRGMNKPREALAAASKAIEIRQAAEYLFLRSMIYMALGEYDKAVEDLQAVQKAQEDAAANVDMAFARAYLGLGRKDMAQVFYNSAQKKIDKGEDVDSRLKEEVEALLR